MVRLVTILNSISVILIHSPPPPTHNYAMSIFTRQSMFSIILVWCVENVITANRRFYPFPYLVFDSTSCCSYHNRFHTLRQYIQQDTVLLWRSICSNRLLSNVEIILFLNKCDVLKAKIRAGIRFAHYCTTYDDHDGTRNDAENVARCECYSLSCVSVNSTDITTPFCPLIIHRLERQILFDSFRIFTSSCTQTLSPLMIASVKLHSPQQMCSHHSTLFTNSARQGRVNYTPI